MSAENKRSLIERAAEVYDFNAALNPFPVEMIPAAPDAISIRHPDESQDPFRATIEPLVKRSMDSDFRQNDEAVLSNVSPTPALPPLREGRAPCHSLDREALRTEGFVDPAAPPTSLSEELRIVKRQLLARAFAPEATPRDRLILVNSAHPGDGKTWLTINLALSLSAEREIDVLLVDGDFGKPALSQQLGLPAGPGFMDALADPALCVADLVVPTDNQRLSVLRAGRQINDDTEVLASERTQSVLDSLVTGHPRRIVLFDSPPALAASAASELARHVGMVLLVVRADRTSDVALRDAVQLLSACPNIQAVLNGVKFSSSGRLFGAYYGKRGG